jgi:guanylate kinase
MDQYIAGKSQVIDGKGERVWIENAVIAAPTAPKLKGKLYLIVGPSGTGKSTLARALSQKHGIPEVISHTTRAPRLGEVEGVNYHFVTREYFIQMRERGEFIEHVEYNGNLYGSARGAVIALLEKGDATIVVEGHGAEQFKAAFPDDSEVLFLYPPTDEELRRRLELRGDKPDIIDLRMKSKEHEMVYAWKWEQSKSDLLPWRNRIFARSVDDLVIKALRIIEERRGVARDLLGNVIEPGQRVAFPIDNDMMAGEVLRIEPPKKVLGKRGRPQVVVRVDIDLYFGRHPKGEVKYPYSNKMVVVR